MDLTASSGNYERRVRFNCSFFVFAVLPAAAVYVSPRSPGSVRCDSHHDGAIAAAFHGFYSLCGSVEGCFCACACLFKFVRRPEQNLDISTYTFLRFSKAPVQYADIPTTTNGTTSSKPRAG